MLEEFFESPFRIQELRCGQMGACLKVCSGVVQGGLCRDNGSEAHSSGRAPDSLDWSERRNGRHVGRTDDRGLRAAPESMPMPTIWPRTPAKTSEGCASVSPICPVRRYRHDPGRTGNRRGSGPFGRVPRLDAPATRHLPMPPLYNYSLHLRELLKSLGEDPGRFDAHKLRQFILDASQRCGWAAAKKCTTAVRIVSALSDRRQQVCCRLGGILPVLAHWRLSSCRGICNPMKSNG